MKLALAAILLAATALAPARLHAQASEIPSAAPPAPTGDEAQRGRALIDQMIAALGGPLWLNRADMQTEGRGSVFFHGEPDPYTIEFHETRRFASSGQPDADRIGFLSPRGVIMPGKKIDVVQIWTGDKGYEVTYKGKGDIPKEQVDDYNRRRAHSIEEVVHSWINAPGVMILDEGTTMMDRHMVNKVTILTANNDAVTLALDATTHLPLQRTFQWRNPQFKDFDVEQESYDDYHTFQGLPTPMTITRYHNGDMTSQRYFTKVEYNVPTPPNFFDPDAAIPKYEKKK